MAKNYFNNIPVIKSNRLIALLDLIKGTSLNGFAGFYFFILIRGGLREREEKVIRHEGIHIERMRKQGYFRWMWKYMTDKEFREREEQLAGSTL